MVSAGTVCLMLVFPAWDAYWAFIALVFFGFPLMIFMFIRGNMLLKRGRMVTGYTHIILAITLAFAGIRFRGLGDYYYLSFDGIVVACGRTHRSKNGTEVVIRERFGRLICLSSSLHLEPGQRVSKPPDGFFAFVDKRKEVNPFWTTRNGFIGYEIFLEFTPARELLEQIRSNKDIGENLSQ